jgi:hypothetical protein
MSATRNEIVKQAQAWIGLNEYDNSFKKIIDIYNTITPLPVGYKLKYTDAWCAGFVSAVAQFCEATDIIPAECSCPRMITKAQSMGIWVENDAYKPIAGDIILYDWDDYGYGDNYGSSDHVGIVEKVSGNTITVIEGNYSNAVKRRTMLVNGRYIRGYIVPKYEVELVESEKVETAAPADTLPMLRIGDTGRTVVAMQLLLIGYGYNCGGYGADGEFGNGTHASVRSFQNDRGLEVDGICGPKTWSALLGIK